MSATESTTIKINLLTAASTALEIGSEEFGLGIHCLEIFYLAPFFMESGVPVNSGINCFRNCS